MRVFLTICLCIFYTFASAAKLNEEQKGWLKDYLVDVIECRSKQDTYLQGMPQAFALNVIETRNGLDKLYVKLLTNEFTVGEANREKNDLQTKSAAKFMQIEKDYVDALNATLKNDAERRQRAAEILAPYILNNKPYQVPMPQQPVIHPSVNTTCYKMGDQIHCTSN